MKWLRRLFGVKRYRRLELALVDYRRAEELLKLGKGWRLAKEEDTNRVIGEVWLERVEEIIE